MTREKAKELLPIIQAWTEGKKIQLKSCSGKWTDIEENEGLSFRYSPSDYRIKPEPKYRPFKTKEECWDEMHKHPDFGWIKGNVTDEYKQVIRIYGCETELIFNISHNNTEDYSPEMMFYCYTFTDGTPFGIKEDIKS